MTDLAALVVRMQADNSQYIKALDQATTKLQKFSKDQNDLLSGLAGSFVGALSVGAIADFAAKSIESAASLDRMSQSAGVSVESLSSLKLAAAASGLSQDELGMALKKLNVNISEAAGNANSKAAIAFKSMGISVKDAAGNVKTADVVLSELATKFAGYADGPNKTAIAVALLGRQGQNLIPVLNEGAAGLDAFKEKAQAAGLVISTGAAQAAEEFSQKVNVLKATVVDGLGVQLQAKLVPALNAMVDAFEKGGGAGEKLAALADVIATGIKLVVSAFIVGATAVTDFGDAIGNAGAILLAVAKGNFKEAGEIYSDGIKQRTAITQAGNDQLNALWHTQSAAELAAIKAQQDAKADLEKKKPQAPNVAGGTEANTAVKELEKFNANLHDQAAAFGLGGAALVNYKLQFGPLADAIKAAGSEGQKLAAQIRANAAALQTKEDTKKIDDANNAIIKQIALHGQGAIAAAEFESKTGELGKAFERLGEQGEIDRQKFVALKTAEAAFADTAAVTALDDKMKELAGDTATATARAFDLKNAPLRGDLKATGDTAGLATIDAAEKQAVLQAQINDLNTKAGQIQTDLSVTEGRINAQIAQGQTTQLDGEAQLAAARANALTQLQAIGTQEQAIATAAGTSNIALVDGVKKFQASLVTLQTQAINPLIATVREGLESAFADNFEKLISGAESFKQAALGMLKDIEKQMLQLISKNFAQQLFGTGGAGGGIAPLLASLFGSGGGAAAIPAFATGGTLGSGSMGIVGEDGPELVYSGAKDMQVIPGAAAARTTNVTNHFTVQSANGQISRASQSQTAAAAARALGAANRRNNG